MREAICALSIFALAGAMWFGAWGETMSSGMSLETSGFETTWGYQLTVKLRESSENVVIPIDDCEVEGFIHDNFTEYKQPSVRRTERSGRITATAGAVVKTVCRDVCLQFNAPMSPRGAVRQNVMCITPPQRTRTRCCCSPQGTKWASFVAAILEAQEQGWGKGIHSRGGAWGTNAEHVR